MSPIIHCVRHAQGYHNLSSSDDTPSNEEKYHDPDLTTRGKEQCKRLAADFPYHGKIDCILSSPIRRTIQTALIGFEKDIEEKNLKLMLVPRAQETSAKPSDTGSDVKKLHEEFKGKLDDKRMEDGWKSNKGEWKMEMANIEQHVVELRRYIASTDFKEVVLVAHGGFLHYFTEDWSDNPDGEGSTGWANTEFRTYEFVKGEGGHLKKTQESRERRGQRPAGGFRKENGEADENGSGGE